MTVTLLPEIAAFFLIVLARVGTLMMLMPAIGETVIPGRLRLVLALLLAFALYPLVTPLLPTGLTASPVRLAGLLATEIAVGVFVGLAARLVLAAMQIAGAAVANQLGLGFVTTVDPTQGAQAALVGNFLSLLAVTLIFATDLHHLSLTGIVGSYTLFRPGDLMPVDDFAAAAVMMVGDAFRVGAQVAAPFLVFGIIFNVGVGLLQKMMPQFQVFFVALPASILVGFVVLALVLGTIMAVYLDHVDAGLTRLAPV